MATLKVRVTKARRDSFWYASRVGDVFEVVEGPDEKNYTVKPDAAPKEVGIESYHIFKDDCVVVEEEEEDTTADCVKHLKDDRCPIYAVAVRMRVALKKIAAVHNLDPDIGMPQIKAWAREGLGVD